MENEVCIFAAVPVAPEKRRGLAYVPKPDYTQAPCSRCGEVMWVGEHLRDVLDLGHEVFCLGCVAEFYVESGVNDLTVRSLSDVLGTGG